jgi:tetratricopeptide (TPR) repeat protein
MAAPSRLLSRLDAAITAAKTPLKADCLRAERAGALARRGEVDEARQVLAALHMKYASNPHAVMSAWLCWGDGLLSYYSDLGRTAAHDRMRRAYALSGAARDMPLHALAAAWLALCEYNQGDDAAAARHVAEALTLAEPDHHAARTRACLVVAQLYHFGGRYDLAQPWYAQGRYHAQTEGDEAAMSALLHNMAWTHVGEVRQAQAQGQVLDVSPQMMLGADSTHNFDALTGLLSLNALVPILQAQVRTLQGEWRVALDLFEAHLGPAMHQGLEHMESKLRADMAWCHAQLGDSDRALYLARQAAQTAGQEADRDDRAAAHSRLAQVFDHLDCPEEAARHRLMAEPEWAEHVRHQQALVAALDAALAKVQQVKNGV